MHRAGCTLHSHFVDVDVSVSHQGRGMDKRVSYGLISGSAPLKKRKIWARVLADTCPVKK